MKQSINIDEVAERIVTCQSGCLTKASEELEERMTGLEGILPLLECRRERLREPRRHEQDDSLLSQANRLVHINHPWEGETFVIGELQLGDGRYFTDYIGPLTGDKFEENFWMYDLNHSPIQIRIEGDQAVASYYLITEHGGWSNVRPVIAGYFLKQEEIEQLKKYPFDEEHKRKRDLIKKRIEKESQKLAKNLKRKINANGSVNILPKVGFSYPTMGFTCTYFRYSSGIMMETALKDLDLVKDYQELKNAYRPCLKDENSSIRVWYPTEVNTSSGDFNEVLRFYDGMIQSARIASRFFKRLNERLYSARLRSD